MRNAAVTAAKLALGAAIIFYLIYFVGLGQIYKTLLEINLAYLPLIIAVFTFSVAMRALNFKVLLQPHEKGRKISLWKLAWISIASWAAGMFTPGKLGEFSSILLLKKEGLDVGASAAVSLINKIYVTAAVGIFAVLGVLKFLGPKEILTEIFLSTGVVIAMIIMLTVPSYILFTNQQIRQNIFGRFLNKYENQFAGFANEFASYLIKRKRLLFYSLLLNIAWIAVSSWLFVLAFAAVGQQVGFIDVMLINSIGTTTSFIPLTIGGTGLREASALAFFSKLGISNTTILASHLIIAAVSYTLAGLTALLFLARKNR
ncbi:MAG TPA: lysylphosphatidylglycerol synthase transmembrane domain-containing protein [Candidatus Nanoarchaeia archaeon]|nr:lysylphosphatidylglycerol synthase transmembrane domain-containing protein [Candidatus Nanoarchaeia archaeon]